jgi:hypothetical protein
MKLTGRIRQNPTRAHLLTLAALTLGAISFQTPSPVQAQTQSTKTNLPFSTTGQPVWAPGMNNLDYTWSAKKSWGPAGGSIGGTFSAGPFGEFGAWAGAHTSGKAGLDLFAGHSGGTVSVDYPIDLTISYPANGLLYPGDPFSITTSYVRQPTGQQLTTEPPTTRVKLQGTLIGNFSVSAGAEAFSRSLFDGDIVNVSVNEDKSTIFDTSTEHDRAMVENGQS